MPPQLLVDIPSIDLSKIAIPIERVREVNRQRFEMEQLSGIIHVDYANQFAIGFKDCRDDEFWVRGHIPGRPLLPGVLMIEAAAQLCSFYFSTAAKDAGDRFIGFGGVTDVKFRGTVVPGDRLVIVAKCIELKSRRAIFATQGIVGDRLVYEGTIIGMPV
ncbi:MAG: beta-hydroxyacyl-ACP dehydratase [Planctomycetota bacterium]|nr:beta-hydroxyacyl-ACP dehydratase [Planctomycetota bacterium]